MRDFNLFAFVSELPEPLSKEEFKYYYDRMKSGDSSAREKLIVHNIRLVLKTVGVRFLNTPYESEELVAVGLMGLIKSIDKFDLSRNIEFTTFATRVIENDILLFMRKNRNHVNNQSLYIPLNIDNNGNELLIEDTLTDRNVDLLHDYLNKESVDEIMYLIDKLSKRNKKVLMLYFGFYNNKRYTQVEIAEIMEMSQSFVSKIIRTELKKLQNLYFLYQNELLPKKEIKYDNGNSKTKI